MFAISNYLFLAVALSVYVALMFAYTPQYLAKRGVEVTSVHWHQALMYCAITLVVSWIPTVQVWQAYGLLGYLALRTALKAYCALVPHSRLATAARSLRHNEQSFNLYTAHRESQEHVLQQAGLSNLNLQ